MADLLDELLALERRAWEASMARDGAWYADNLADEALLVFWERRVVSRDGAIAGVSEAPNVWTRYDIEEPRTLRLSEDAALLIYHVRAERDDGAVHDAMASTGFVRRDGRWRIVFHQQTPVA